MSEELSLLLIGKTGVGKSATGNSILNRSVFKTSASFRSETKKVDFNFTQFGRHVLHVVDGPGLEDTDMYKVKDTTATAKRMDQALAMCYGGVDAFVLVLKFGMRFTSEDMSTLETLKLIFGDSYFNHVIVVMTGGDLYNSAMDEECCYINFDEWCRKQRGAFHLLHQACNGRFVLFNNREKNEEKKEVQVQEIVQLALGLQNRHGRYTSDCFSAAEAAREKMITELKALQLNKKIQEKISLLIADIENFSKHSSDNDRETVTTRIHDLMYEIDVQDRGYDIFSDMRKLVKKIEENHGNITELKRLADELECIRKSKTIWSELGSVVTFVGGVISHTAPVVGSTLKTDVNETVLTTKEKVQ